MSTEPTRAVEQALAELRSCVARRKQPTRQNARAILIALGRLPDLPTTGKGWGERVREAAGKRLEGWEAAVKEELMLACTEHVQSVDPRYLDHPRYDFEYTVTAREELEARLKAAQVLGQTVDETLLRKVERADRLLDPYLRQQRDPERG